MRMPLLERLMKHTDRRGPDECWPWMRYRNKAGYGFVAVNRKPQLAHRVMYELTHRPLLPGEAVCHSCDNPSCVNPAHLWLGSVADNNADRHSKGRSRGASHKGTSNPMARLSEADVLAIVSATGTLEEIAARFGMAFQNVSDIKRGKIWSHVTGIKNEPHWVDGLTPQARQLLGYLKANASNGTIKTYDKQIAADLGWASGRIVTFAKQRLKRAGFIERVGHHLWSLQL
jgi:hypothetical protein